MDDYFLFHWVVCSEGVRESVGVVSLGWRGGRREGEGRNGAVGRPVTA